MDVDRTVDYADHMARRLQRDALLLLPLGFAALGLVGCLLGPYLASVGGGIGPEAGGLLALLRLMSGHRWLALGVLLVLLLGTLAGSRTAAVRRAVAAGGLPAAILGRVILSLPILMALALLLQSIVAPLTQALDTTP